jgi:TRAPP trafficking subunit Trs65
VFFTPTAALQPISASPYSQDGNDDYLPSQVPRPLNLLQPLGSDLSMGEVKPYLPASRMNKRISGVPNLSEVRHIRFGPRKLFRAAPAFLWRIRFVRFPNLAEQDAILALFDIEITHFAACNVSIDSIDLNLTSGSFEAVGVQLPIESQPGEQLTLIYKILPSEGLEKILEGSDNSRVITITLTSTVLVSDSCLPVVKIKWKQILETPPSRPPSRSAPMSATHDQPSHVDHDALTMTGQPADVQSSTGVANGVTLNITTPPMVTIGQIFSWQVLVVNRSDQVQRIALLPIPKRRLGDHIAILNRPGSTGSTKDVIAAPTIDENVLYSIQKTSIQESSDLVCLTPDVKIGLVTELLSSKFSNLQ